MDADYCVAVIFILAYWAKSLVYLQVKYSMRFSKNGLDNGILPSARPNPGRKSGQSHFKIVGLTARMCEPAARQDPAFATIQDEYIP
jgi:hypothetical protein